MFNINVKIDKNSFSNSSKAKIYYNALCSLESSGLNFELDELLLHIAYATRNPFDDGMSLNYNWALLRYYKCFDNGKYFRLRKEYENVDSHQKTILSDDFGMGFTSLYLQNTLGIRAMTDTKFFLKHLNSIKVKSASNNRGQFKSPDFIVLDKNYMLHIAESKGTQSSISVSKGQCKLGKKQKGNLEDKNGLIKEKLVIGTYISKYFSNESSQILIVDPDYDLNFNEVDEMDLVDYSIFYQFLKEISFVLPSKIVNKLEKTNINDPGSIYETIEVLSQVETVDGMYIKNETYLSELNLKRNLNIKLIINEINQHKTLRSYLNIKNKEFGESKYINKNVFMGMFGLFMKLELPEDQKEYNPLK